MSDDYRLISGCYNVLSFIYSFGQIPRCRQAFLEKLAEDVKAAGLGGVTVMFAGVGHGSEAILAAQCGANVIVVDLSRSMLDVFSVKLLGVSSEVRGRIEVIHGDVRNTLGKFDWVISNFFLNVFTRSEMCLMLNVLVTKCQTGGNLVIGDFYWDVDGSKLMKYLRKMNWHIVLKAFRLFVNNADHGIYNYSRELEKLGWKELNTKKYRVFGIKLYQSNRYLFKSDNK